jgi:hypothetical protein
MDGQAGDALLTRVHITEDMANGTAVNVVAMSSAIWATTAVLGRRSREI